MALYSNDVINEVFAENDIVDYVSQYVALKKSGRDYSGLCPFHNEKSPSFHVSREKQLFHCFGCGASGNLAQFVMRSEGIDFVEALKLLADRAGIVLPEDNNSVDYALHEKKKKIYEMNKAAARFFYRELTESEAGKEGLRYFKERKLLPKTIKCYGLGYAPNDYSRLRVHMNELGYKDAELVEAGLISERNGRFYDRFRGRVMFPIIDLRGNIIGFGGRIIHQTEEETGYKPPKYLNSAETPVFNKGKNLFSLNFAKKDNSGSLILAEGYMDVISVYQAGIINVVATLGTALTDAQARLMLKYCSEILICYDSDEPGQKAAARAIDIINHAGGRSKVIRLEGAKDPDEYIKKNGVEMFRHALHEATPSTEYLISSAKSQYNLDVPEGKIYFVNDAAKILSGINDAVEVDAYIKKISAETEISKDAIYSEYNKMRKKEMRSTQKRKIMPHDIERPTVSPVSIGSMERSGSAAEKKLLNLIVQSRKLCRKAMENLAPEDFSNAVYQALAKRIFENYQNNIASEPPMLLNGFDGDDIKTASAVFYNMEVYDDVDKTFDELIISIKKEKISERIMSEKDPGKLKLLLEEKQRLNNSNLKG